MAHFIAATGYSKSEYFELTMAERDAITSALNRAARR